MKKLLLVPLMLVSGIAVNMPISVQAMEEAQNKDGGYWKSHGEIGIDEDGKPLSLGFEFGNEAPYPLWIQVWNGSASSGVRRLAAANQAGISSETISRVGIPLDTAKRTFLLISKKEPQGADMPDMVFTFEKGKTIFVLFNPTNKNSLRPAIGRFGGLSSTSASGLSLSNNVSQDNIGLMSSSQALRIIALPLSKLQPGQTAVEALPEEKTMTEQERWEKDKQEGIEKFAKELARNIK